MDKKAIKKFAIESRSSLISGVTNRLSKLGITLSGIEEPVVIDSDLIEIKSSGERYSGKEVVNRSKIVDELNRRESGSEFKVAFDTFVEEISYTWFNRLIAIRFMEVNDYLPERLRVLSSENSGKKEPDLITNLLETNLYRELNADGQSKIVTLLSDGSAEAVDELYQLIFIKVCNDLNKYLPDLFEKMDDYTELLFTFSYIDENGVIASLLTVPEEDFDVEKGGQIEIIGWMYQYYNSEPKDKVFARGNRKIRSDEIPAATQLFTPDWIVRYMVENSLGRYYIDQKLANTQETRTEKEIANSFGWKYYLPSAEQPEEVQLQIIEERKDNEVFALQELKLIDPSMGSGHILVYAFDVLMQLYEAEGELPRMAAEIILEKNLFGLDIDKRAFQLTYFALMMKGRQYSRRILNKEIRPNVYAIPDNFGVTSTDLQLVQMNFSDNTKAHEDLVTLLEGFKDGKDLGSLIEFTDVDFDNLKIGFNDSSISFLNQAFYEMICVGELLQFKYQIVITNPPYVGSSGFNPNISKFAKKEYPNSKSDLFAMFIERWNKSISQNGYNTMVTMQSWMFLSSYEKMRKNILNDFTIVNLMHMENMVMEIAFGTAVAIFNKASVKNFKGTYHQVKTRDASGDKIPEVPVLGNRFNQISQSEFKKIPGSPISYWVSENLIRAFEKQIYSDKFRSAGRMKTHNNLKYTRYFWEVNFDNTIYDKWLPYHNGGPYRKWYGNEYEVVAVTEDSINYYKGKGGYPNATFVGEKGITWNLITSSTNSFRIKEEKYLYSSAAPTIINKDNKEPGLFFDAISFLNSSISKHLIQALNPTLNTTVGDVLSLPYVSSHNKSKQFVNKNIEISKYEWNSFESSWDFKKHPLA